MKTTLAAGILACLTTPAIAGTDSFLEYNCMGLSAPTEVSTIQAGASKVTANKDSARSQVTQVVQGKVLKIALLPHKTAPLEGSR